MKHDKLVFIRIICLVGIIGETLWTRTKKADRETGAADNNKG